MLRKHLSLLLLGTIVPVLALEVTMSFPLTKDNYISDGDRTDGFDGSLGVPCWIVLSNLSVSPFPLERRIFVYLESQFFSAENASRICLGLAARYPDPVDLRIVVYSDREMLQRAIKLFERPIGVPGGLVTQEKLEAESDQFAKSVEHLFPTRSGYFRCRYHRPKRGEAWLEYSPDPNREEMITIERSKQPDYRGELNSDLLIASKSGDILKVRDLLNLGANVHVEGDLARTPLMEAAFGGWKEIVRVLLKQGAKLNQCDNAGYTPLLFAVISRNKDKDLIKHLLRSGAEIEATDKGAGGTPLIYAADDAHITLLLLDHGANINAQNKSGRTALMIAAARGNAATVKVLLNRGADPSLKDNEGSTALSLARQRGSTEAEKLLRVPSPPGSQSRCH